MIGPTGVGKTEIARRLAKLAKAPFLKVEASKFTEVGYVGRDVESMVRDLVEIAVAMVQARRSARRCARPPRRAPRTACSSSWCRRAPIGQLPRARTSEERRRTTSQATREKFREKLRAGELDDRTRRDRGRGDRLPEPRDVHARRGSRRSASTSRTCCPASSAASSKQQVPVRRGARDPAPAGGREADRPRTRWPREARAARRAGRHDLPRRDRQDRRPRRAAAAPTSRARACSATCCRSSRAPPCRPSTAWCKTDHILFIAAGAFHVSKPSDLIPELQGRFPIRVELDALTEQDFVRILTEPETALTKQYSALLVDRGGRRSSSPTTPWPSSPAWRSRSTRTTENIGARRLATLMERLLDEVSFEAPDMAGVAVTGRRRVRPPRPRRHRQEPGSLALCPLMPGGSFALLAAAGVVPRCCSPAAASRAIRAAAARRARHRPRTSRSASRATALLLDFTYPQTTAAGMALGGSPSIEVWEALQPAPRGGQARRRSTRGSSGRSAHSKLTLGSGRRGRGHLRRPPDHRPAAARAAAGRRRRRATTPCAPSARRRPLGAVEPGRASCPGSLRAAPERRRRPRPGRTACSSSGRPAPRVAGYNVYRRGAAGAARYGAPIQLLPGAEQRSWLDTTARFGQSYIYAVTAVVRAAIRSSRAPSPASTRSATRTASRRRCRGELVALAERRPGAAGLARQRGGGRRRLPRLPPRAEGGEFRAHHRAAAAGARVRRPRRRARPDLQLPGHGGRPARQRERARAPEVRAAVPMTAFFKVSGSGNDFLALAEPAPTPAAASDPRLVPARHLARRRRPLRPPPRAGRARSRWTTSTPTATPRRSA